MRENGLKVKDFVSIFNLEVLNRGSDFDSALLTVPDLNRPGLQFHSFYDYFDPCRLQVIGKVSFGPEKLTENYNTLMGAIVKAKPAAAKGQYIRSCVAAATMGPGVRMNTAKLV